MANDLTKEKTIDKEKGDKKPVKKVKKRKLTFQEQRIMSAVYRLSKPTPNFSYMQNYYLP